MTEPITHLNFRDLGGLPAGQGVTASGKLFRSEGPRNFTATQIEELQAFQIRTIIDLRSGQEREEVPHQWHQPSCQWLGLEVDADLRVFGPEGRERLMQGTDPEIAVETMKDTYRSIPGSLACHWPAIVETLVIDRVPALINCTAGKDRTGVAVALLLESVGVSRENILQDYLKSSVFGENMVRAGTIEAGFMNSYGFLPSPGQIDALVGVHADYLEAAWTEVDKQWNGLDNYFEDAGVDQNMREAICAMLIE
ncbi:MAG: tyrosine-protein phosphatase [Parasphingorhabdus sp.]|uniref:tyrosine-protein phosphatase n=1 Tax=Parasphingorhabdus sp. TaxID=2709688 RepID=UPI00300109A6